MADVIPSTNRVDWTAGTHTGVIGGIPNRTTISATINSTGDTTDRTAVINAALGSAGDGEVVLLGPGTFRTLGTINIPSNVTLRLSDSSIIDYRGAGSAINLGNGGQDWPYSTDGDAVTSNAPKGDTTVSLSGGTANFASGTMVVFAQDNWDTNTDPEMIEFKTDGSGGRWRRQVSMVSSKTANTITFFPPLYTALDTARSPQCKAISTGYMKANSMEGGTLDCTNSTGQVAVEMWQCFGSWVQGVRIIEAGNQGVYMLMCLNCEIRKVYVDGLQNAGSNGAGILFERSSACLVEDNIIDQAFPCIEVNFGSTGNVFAFNFCNGNGDAGLMGAAIDSNHGPHNAFNLYEGNWASNLQSDGYYGSESNALVARNRLHGTNESGAGTSDIYFSRCIDFCRMAWQMNAVGNVLGMNQSWWTTKAAYTIEYERTADSYGYEAPTIYRLGFPNIGNTDYIGTAQPSLGDFWADWPTPVGTDGYQERDLDVTTYLLRKGNYNYVDGAIPASESLGSDTISNSYFRSSKPDYFGVLDWPAYSPDAPVMDLQTSAEQIPSGYRFYNGDEPPSGGPIVNVTTLNVTTLTVG